jgi:hypothetical protein
MHKFTHFFRRFLGERLIFKQSVHRPLFLSGSKNSFLLAVFSAVWHKHVLDLKEYSSFLDGSKRRPTTKQAGWKQCLTVGRNIIGDQKKFLVYTYLIL